MVEQGLELKVLGPSTSILNPSAWCLQPGGRGGGRSTPRVGNMVRGVLGKAERPVEVHECKVQP